MQVEIETGGWKFNLDFHFETLKLVKFKSCDQGAQCSKLKIICSARNPGRTTKNPNPWQYIDKLRIHMSEENILSFYSFSFYKQGKLQKWSRRINITCMSSSGSYNLCRNQRSTLRACRCREGLPSRTNHISRNLYCNVLSDWAESPSLHSSCSPPSLIQLQESSAGRLCSYKHIMGQQLCKTQPCYQKCCLPFSLPNDFVRCCW